MDKAEGRELRPIGSVELFPMVESQEEFIRSTVQAGFDSSINPWEHEFVARSYYANASGESWQLIMSVAPIVERIVNEEALKLLASAFFGALFRNLLRVPDWFKREPPQTLEEVTARIRRYVAERDDLAPTQLEEISAEKLDDGTFELVLRRSRDSHLLLVRTDDRGLITATLDLSEVDAYVQRTKSTTGEGANAR